MPCLYLTAVRLSAIAMKGFHHHHLSSPGATRRRWLNPLTAVADSSTAVLINAAMLGNLDSGFRAQCSLSAAP